MPDQVQTARIQPKPEGREGIRVALLTGGGDRPYALGIAAALAAQGMSIDFIGSDELKSPEMLGTPQIRFLNLRGDQSPDAPFLRKSGRVLLYYFRIFCYAINSRPRIFHILWNNKFLYFDRTLVMLFYRALGKRIAFTVHNVNAGQRDASDSRLNRLTLRIQYRLSDHLFVHTEGMKSQLVSEFGIPEGKVSVIPFGINSTVPDTALTPSEARRRIGATAREKTVLFFGNIAPYKGLEYLVEAMALLAPTDPDYRLVIIGRPKGAAEYWQGIVDLIAKRGLRPQVIERIEFVPDEETEVYFKSADVLVLPYTHIFQSGVLFLAYNFGVPVIAADVGSLREDIIEGTTGTVFRARDSEGLAKAIAAHFVSDLYRNPERTRRAIRDYANERYSWAKVAKITEEVYSDLLARS